MFISLEFNKAFSCKRKQLGVMLAAVNVYEMALHDSTAKMCGSWCLTGWPPLFHANSSIWKFLVSYYTCGVDFQLPSRMCLLLFLVT